MSDVTEEVIRAAVRVEDVERFTVNVEQGDIRDDIEGIKGDWDDFHVFSDHDENAAVYTLSSPSEVGVGASWGDSSVVVFVTKEDAAQVARVLRRAVGELERLADDS